VAFVLNNAEFKAFAVSFPLMAAVDKFTIEAIFYPESGGQMQDKGTIEPLSLRRMNAPEGALVHKERPSGERKLFTVVNVRKSGSDVIIELDSEGLKEGDLVHGILDWEYRYFMMRSHTAAHCLSAVINRETQALVTGKQLGMDKSRVDFNLSDFNAGVAGAFVEKANEEIEKGYDVKWRIVSREEAESIPGVARLAKGLPLGLKELRIVEIAGKNGEVLDMQACGGTHVRNTKEIGKLSVTS